VIGSIDYKPAASCLFEVTFETEINQSMCVPSFLPSGYRSFYTVLFCS